MAKREEKSPKEKGINRKYKVFNLLAESSSRQLLSRLIVQSLCLEPWPVSSSSLVPRTRSLYFTSHTPNTISAVPMIRGIVKLSCKTNQLKKTVING